MSMTPIPVYRARLPAARQLLPYLERVDESRWYTNRGQLACELEHRLCSLLTADTAHVVTAANGTAALEAAILATSGRATHERPLALVPAYTFVATAMAVERCGYAPYLLDVDERTWALDPDALLDHPRLSSAGVVVPVAPYGRALRYDAWVRFAQRTGVPVVIDAAAAFESFVADPRAMAGSVPVALSFQVTKSFSTAEGGAVVWSDFEGITRVARSLNFGFLGKRESTASGTNAKLSEYHAAVGLASLDGWARTRAANAEVTQTYRRFAHEHGLGERVIVAPDIASNYALFLANSDREAEAICAALDAQQIESRLWYGKGLHHEPYWRNVARDATPHTDRLAPVLVGLPVFEDIAADDIARVVATLAHVAVAAERPA